MREARTEVLVVGAGPVGLWTALLLAEAGVEVSIIDREPNTTARTYACALHARTLKLLEKVGLVDAVLQQGRRVEKVAFYEGNSRYAEVDLAALGGPYPFLVILPQQILEKLLEQRLQESGVAVRWNHRLDHLAAEPELAAATIEELGGTSLGYIVPHWETVVKDRSILRAQFVVGADGHDSSVRRQADLEYQPLGPVQCFAAFEFEAALQEQSEVRVVLTESSTSVLWPLLGEQYRWTFELNRGEGVPEFPLKERRAVKVAHPELDEIVRHYIQTLARKLAPWFAANIGAITWSSEVAFAARLASRFGRDRCWLAGDAAHQTGPVGVQSLNMGFVEGEALSRHLARILREAAPLDVLESYQQEQDREWRRLLGTPGGLNAEAGASPWVAKRRSRLLACLPATDGDLEKLAQQLALHF